MNWKQFRTAYRFSLAEGNLAKARHDLQMAVATIIEQNLQVQELAIMYNQLAKLSLQINDPASAEVAARKSIQTEMEFGPPNAESDHLAAFHVMLADALQQQGKYTEALTELNRGITLYLKHLREDDKLIRNLGEWRDTIKVNVWRE